MIYGMTPEEHEARWIRAAQRALELAEQGRMACRRCGGSGIYHTYGRCFRCGGDGADPEPLKTPSALKRRLEAQRNAAEAVLNPAPVR